MDEYTIKKVIAILDEMHDRRYDPSPSNRTDDGGMYNDGELSIISEIRDEVEGLLSYEYQIDAMDEHSIRSDEREKVLTKIAERLCCYGNDAKFTGKHIGNIIAEIRKKVD